MKTKKDIVEKAVLSSPKAPEGFLYPSLSPIIMVQWKTTPNERKLWRAHFSSGKVFSSGDGSKYFLNFHPGALGFHDPI